MKKKYVLGVIAGIVGYSIHKYSKFKKTLQQLKVAVKRIDSIDINIKEIFLTLTLSLKNGSDDHLGVTSFKLLTLKEIQVFTKEGKFLAKADLNISEIDIPAKQERLITDIPVSLPTQSLLNNLNLFKGNVEENINIFIVFETMGKQFKVLG